MARFFRPPCPNRRWRLFLFTPFSTLRALLCAAAVLLCSTPAVHAARTLSGTVLDTETDLPVPHAIVTITETGASTLADDAGRFTFQSLPDGDYHLCAGRIGYTKRCDIVVQIGAEELPELTIALTPDPLNFPGIEVRGIRSAEDHLAAAAQEIITADQIGRTGAATAADALERTSSVEVIRNSSGTAQASIRGSSPDGVAVIVDGVQINTGQAVDLASIPAAQIASISILEGPAAGGVGIDALAGAILITTRAATDSVGVQARSTLGSFGRRTMQIDLDGLGYRDQRLRVSWQNELSDGEFTYHDTLGGEFTRLNNDSHRQNFAVQAHGVIASGWSWQGGVSYFRLHAGIPGALSQLTPLASRREKRYVYRASISHIDRRGEFDASYSRTTDWNYYVSNGTLPYESEYNSAIDQWRARYSASTGLLDGILGSIEYTHEDLLGTDHLLPAWSFGTAGRHNYAAAIRYTRDFGLRPHWLSAIRLTSAYRYDQTETGADYPTSILSPQIDPPQLVWRFWSPHIGLTLSGTLEEIDWHISAAYGKSYRRAPLLDMFWVESYRTRGNPGLRPERSEQSEIGYGLRSEQFITVAIDQRYFWSRYDDLIFWQIGQGGAWTPANIGRAHIDGREDRVTLSAFADAVSLEFTHQDHQHINKSGEPNTDGQPLPFRYRHKATVTLRGDVGWGYAEVSRRSYGARSLRAAATKWLDPYAVTDIAAGVRMTRYGVRGELGFRIDNITDTEYELIEREPMPGRGYRVNLKLEL